MLQERVASSAGEASAIMDKLMSLSLLQSVEPLVDRFKPLSSHYYRLQEESLLVVPPMQLFPLLFDLSLAIIKTA
ncbi:unnamed protein product, partial [Choristocarpus tenellus]